MKGQGTENFYILITKTFPVLATDQLEQKEQKKNELTHLIFSWQIFYIPKVVKV